MVPVLLLSGHQGHPTHTYTTRTSSTILPKQGEGATLRSAASIDGVGQLSHSHGTKISFSKIPLMMRYWVHLFLTLNFIQQRRCDASSTSIMFCKTWLTCALDNSISSTVLPRQDIGPAFPSVAAGKGEEHLRCLKQKIGNESQEGESFPYPNLCMTVR